MGPGLQILECREGAIFKKILLATIKNARKIRVSRG
jgi:hypothetical protein